MNALSLVYFKNKQSIRILQIHFKISFNFNHSVTCMKCTHITAYYWQRMTMSTMRKHYSQDQIV